MSLSCFQGGGSFKGNLQESLSFLIADSNILWSSVYNMIVFEYLFERIQTLSHNGNSFFLKVYGSHLAMHDFFQFFDSQFVGKFFCGLVERRLAVRSAYQEF